MSISSGYKEFDKAASSESGYIGTGNVISNAMFGFHVRARTELECNGFAFAVGKLQESDLSPASKGYGQDFEAVRRYIRKSEYFENQNGWCYLIRHQRQADRKVVLHGALVTDSQNRLLRRFDRLELEYGRYHQSMKSRGVMDAVLPLLVRGFAL